MLVPQRSENEAREKHHGPSLPRPSPRASESDTSALSRSGSVRDPTIPLRAGRPRNLAEHVREEHSTFTWLLEPMLERVRFEIRDRSLIPPRTYAAYRCIRR